MDVIITLLFLTLVILGVIYIVQLVYKLGSRLVCNIKEKIKKRKEKK